MHLLVPKLTPMQLVLYFSDLIICWFYDDGTTSEVLYGIPPLLAVGLLATSAAAAAAPKIIEGLSKRKALRDYKKSGAFKAQAKLDREAREALKEGKFGPGLAQQRDQVLESQLAFTGQAGQLAADAQRGRSDTQKRKRLQDVIKSIGNFTAKARRDTQKQAATIAAQEKAAAQARVDSAAARKFALESGDAAALAQIGGGIATGVGQATSLGTQAAGAGLFQRPDQTAQVDAIAQNINNQPQPPAAGTPQPAGQVASG